MHVKFIPETESEMFVLGWILVDPSLLTTAEAVLTCHMFYSTQHQIIFHAMTLLKKEGGKCDPSAVCTRIEQASKMVEAGGRKYIFGLPSSATVKDHFAWHVEKIRKAYHGRKVVEMAKRIAENPDNALIEKMREHAVEWISTNDGKGFDLSKDLNSYVDELSNNDRPAPIDTGLQRLDALLGGLHPGDLFVVGARPNVGKTALMTRMALDIAGSVPCVYFPTEMTHQQFLNRILAMRSRVPGSKFRRNTLNSADMGDIMIACSKMHGATKLVIVENSAPSLADISLQVDKHHPTVLFVDYLQLCKKPAGENNTRQNDAFIVGLKGICVEKHLICVLACQANRGVDARGGGDMRLSDLRDSGMIEAAADQVLLLSPEKDEGDTVKVKGLVAKNRHGVVGMTKLILKRSNIEMREEDAHDGLSEEQEIKSQCEFDERRAP